MKILVTGTTGFLGNLLCQKLEGLGHSLTKISTKNCDLRNYESLEPFSQERFDQIYHLATWIQAGDFCMHHQGDVWMNNQRMNTNLLCWWKDKQPQAKMICIGTSCAYDPSYPLSEEYYLKGVPIESLFAYGMAKKMVLAGLRALHEQHGLEYLYVIPSTLYGPGYHTDDRQLHFIFDLMSKILKGKFYDSPVVLWGDGEQKRELVYIDDFIKTLFFLVNTQKNTAINIGEGQEHTIRAFAQKICEKVDYPFEKIIFDTTKYVGTRSKVLIIDKLRKVYPEYHLTSLDEGFKTTIDWYKETLLI